MNKKTRKVLLGAMSIALIAVMAIAGTFAYLQDTSGDVVNSFQANQVKVELEETTGDNYNIIPGTSQDKDPKVTVNNTVDSYVFVKVTDETDGLVSYTVDSGWTKLSEYDNVYYREVAADAETKEFSVLSGDKIFYPSSLTNEDMYVTNADGTSTLKTDIKVSFTAYAIQKIKTTGENGASAAFEPEEAYQAIPVTVQNADGLFEALKDTESGKTVQVKDDIEFDIEDSNDGSLEPVLDVNKDMVLDLGGKDLSLKVDSNTELTQTPTLISVSGGSSLTLTGDGEINAEAGYNNAYAVNVMDGSTLTIKNGTYYGAMTAVQVQKGTAYIEGGFFDLAETIKETAPEYSKYLINCIDAAYKDGTAKVVITGGTFVNFDPSNNEAEGTGTNFVAEGYEVKQEKQSNGDTWYTVVKSAVEETP